jgi:lipopolysaccharide transport system permease protein
VYFPRLVIPVSSTLSGALDFLIALALLFVLMAGYGVPFRMTLLWLPVFSVCALLAALSVGIWLSALNVRYRDVKYIVPFIVTMGLYVSPVGFMSSVVPEQWRPWYGLNPMVGVIDGFRWAVLGPQFEPDWRAFAVGMAMVAALLVSGLLYFRATEKTFADVI